MIPEQQEYYSTIDYHFLRSAYGISYVVRPKSRYVKVQRAKPDRALSVHVTMASDCCPTPAKQLLSLPPTSDLPVYPPH